MRPLPGRQSPDSAPTPSADRALPEVEVVEPRQPDRVRRPQDLLRLVIAVLVIAASLTLGDVAVGTADALEGDLTVAVSGFPLVLLTLLAWVGGLGVIALPIALGADLAFRKRYWQVIQAVVAAGVSSLVVLLLSRLILDGALGVLLESLTRPMLSGRTHPIDAVVCVLVTYLTVCRVVGRRWHQWLAGFVVGSAVLTSFLSGTTTSLALFVSVLLGWAIGLAFRFGFGAPTTLASGVDIAHALVVAGVPLRRLELADVQDTTDREYLGTLYPAVGPECATPSVGDDDIGTGATVQVLVIDRDTFGFATLRSLVRWLRLRGASTRAPAWSVRAEMEQRALMALALEKAGVEAPRLLACCQVGAFSAAVALTPVTGPELAASHTGDEHLDACWRLLDRLQRGRIAHRGLERDALVATVPMAGLRRLANGDIGAEDLALRLDTAQLLTALALAAGPDRAVASGVRTIGVDALARGLPGLQKPALGQDTREALRGTELLDDLQERIVALLPDGEEPPAIELRRVTFKSVVTVVGGGIAAYFLLTMLAKVDIPTLMATANWGWAVGALVCAILTFAGPSLSISGAVEVKLSFARTYMTQLAVAFSGLVAPAAIGNIALNTRYLVRAGVSAPVAGASVGLVQIVQMLSYVVLLLGSGVLAGTGSQASFTPPAKLVAAIPILVLVLIALSAVPWVRRFFAERIMPQVRTVVPQILKVMRDRKKLSRMVVGSLLLDTMFVGALVCATRAFGCDAPIPAVAVVYFAGAIIGSAVPTPGGIGGIEAAISAGLIAIGVESGVAVSSVLLYRLATYWLPIPFGYTALNRLQAQGAL